MTPREFARILHENPLYLWLVLSVAGYGIFYLWKALA